jgi:hypothetical protein
MSDRMERMPKNGYLKTLFRNLSEGIEETQRHYYEPDMLVMKCGSSILLKRNSNIYTATVRKSTIGCGMIKDY